jgi:hypothetical protein
MATRVLSSAAQGLVALALAAVARPARAQSATGDMPTAARTEFAVVPFLGGSSDFGWGGGVLAAIARVSPHREPHVWRLDLASTTLAHFGGGVHVAYQDYYAVLSFAQLVPGRLRLELTPSYTDETELQYSGLGNASPAPLPSGPRAGTFHYGRTHPTAQIRTRITLPHRLFANLGISATYNDLDVAPDSLVSVQRYGGSPAVRDALRGPDRHGVVFFEWALLFDTRDDEVAPTSGHYHQVKLRLAPGGTTAFPYRYGQVNVTLRAFVTPIARRLTLAARAVGDLQFGDVPFYELARYEDTYALGGGSGVRGVPAQRYYGKVKDFGNFETRTDLFDFHLGAKPMTFGFVTFFDAGRLWFDLTPHPELDGTGVGLKYGAGGGLRVRAGHTFLVRADIAWSPDAEPLGGYFQANQAF